jgi:hypothetical protein
MPNQDQDLLFAEHNLLSEAEAQREGLLNEIAGIDPDSLLNASVDDLASYLCEKYRLDVPVLQDSEIAVEQQETQVDMSQDQMRHIRDRSRPFYLPGTEVRYFVPFTGDPDLFHYQASNFSMNPPRGDVTDDQHLILAYTVLGHDPAVIKSQFDSNLARIKQHLDWSRNDVAPFNASLPALAKDAIKKRRQKLLDDRGLVASLGFPLRERPDATKTYVTPTVRRKLPTRPPVTKTAPYVPEPALGMEEYEHILSIMRGMVTVMERSPKAFRAMDEEDIRQHFLVPLNGMYEGQATGETFNYEGKTDILIRDKGKNIFIAECKLWDGPKSLSDAIDQLLGYTTWRDTKTAILVFNRTRNFSRVVGKIPEVVRTNPNFKRAMSYDQEAGFRAVLSNRDDTNRELIMTVLTFDIPQ